MRFDEAERELRIDDTTLREGDLLTLDGTDGAVYAGAAHNAVEPLVELQARLKHLRATQGNLAKVADQKTKHAKFARP